jgi:hypothetical protein
MNRIEKIKAHIKNVGPKLHETSSSLLGLVSVINKNISQGVMRGAPAVRTAFAVITVAQTILDIKSNISSFKGLKVKAKAITIANIIIDIGSITDVVKQMTRFIAELAKKGASNLSTISTLGVVLGVFSLGVQVISTTVESIELRSLFKQSKKFKLAAAEGKQGEYLTEKAAKSKGLRSLFNPLSTNQTTRISTIYSNAQDDLKTQVTAKIQRRFTQLKTMKALSIALSIISVVGLMIFMFAPTPLAPVAWGIVGTVAALSLARIIAGFATHYRFSKYLTAAATEANQNIEMKTFSSETS